MTKAKRDQLSPRLSAVWALAFEEMHSAQLDTLMALNPKSWTEKYENNKQLILEMAISSADTRVSNLKNAEWEMERYT